MRNLITTAAAATLLLAAPLAAVARDQSHGYGAWGSQSHSYYPSPGWKHGHYKHGYAPAYVGPYAYYPAPRVVVPPVYVPVPAPVIAVPAPYSYPQYPASSVSIGFRFFF